jgi:hypothetical protein
VHGGAAGDGVLIGGEEEELPAFLIAVEADEIADVLDGVFLGGVFLTIGEDGEDDFAGLLPSGRALMRRSVSLMVRPMASSKAVLPRGV